LEILLIRLADKRPLPDVVHMGLCSWFPCLVTERRSSVYRRGGGWLYGVRPCVAVGRVSQLALRRAFFTCISFCDISARLFGCWYRSAQISTQCTNCEFLATHHSQSHISCPPVSVNERLFALSASLVRFGWGSVQETCTECSECRECRENGRDFLM
jgi:hypothetical protein